MLLRIAVILPMACCGIFIAISSFSSKKDDSLFSYHPAFMSIASMLLLPLSISIIAAGRSSSNATNHAFVNFVLGICVLLGAAAVFAAKENAKKPHIQSPHAVIGVAAIVTLLLNHALAVFKSAGVSRPNIRSALHVWLGRISRTALSRSAAAQPDAASQAVLLAASTVLGLASTKWAARVFGDTAAYLAGACAVGTALIIIAAIFQLGRRRYDKAAASPSAITDKKKP